MVRSWLTHDDDVGNRYRQYNITLLGEDGPMCLTPFWAQVLRGMFDCAATSEAIMTEGLQERAALKN